MKSPVIFMLKIQFLAVVFLTGFTYSFSGFITAYSLALGTVLHIIPNAYFSIYAFRYQGATNATWITRSFSRGESGKLMLTLVGFALIFRFVKPLSSLSLFAGFCCMLVLQWFIARKISDAFSK